MIPVFKCVERQPDGTDSLVYFHNLICFILNTGTEILRELVYSKVKKEDVVKFFSSEKIVSELSQLITNKRLTKEQFEMLTNNPDQDSLDISVLMILLTNENIFDLPHESLKNDLKCLRNLRDGILHHLKLHLNKTLFEGYLKQISEILKRIINILSVEKQSYIRLRLKSERKRAQETMMEPYSNAFLVFVNWFIRDTDDYQSAIEIIELKTPTGANKMDEMPPSGRAVKDSKNGRSSNEIQDTKTEMTTVGADRMDDTPLLTGWATGNSPDGRVFYVNHDTRTATWFQGLFGQEQIYCLTCKKKTNTDNIVLYRDPSTKRRMVRGVCSVCGKKKSMFLKLYEEPKYVENPVL